MCGWLATMGVSWRPHSRLGHVLGMRYVGDQEGWELQSRVPTRARFDGYLTLDYAVSVQEPAGLAGLSLSGGIRNLTDQYFASVATPAQFPEGLPHGGREFWLAAEYAF